MNKTTHLSRDASFFWVSIRGFKNRVDEKKWASLDACYTCTMHCALDGRPLEEPKTGVGHYTFELVRSLAVIAPSDIFTLLATKSHKVPSTADNGQLPENLHKIRVRPGSLNWRWWSVGLPLYLRW